MTIFIQSFPTFFKALLVCVGIFFNSSVSLHAQASPHVQNFLAQHDLLLDVQLLANTDYTDISVWKQKSTQQGDNLSGELWTNTFYQYQYALFNIEKGRIARLTLYEPNGDIQKRYDFYYLDNLLSAIDEMKIDEKGKDLLICTTIFFYEKSGRIFQQVRTFPREQGFREIMAYSFDTENKLIQTKVAYTGTPKQAQTLARLGNGLELISYEYYGEKRTINTYKNYNTLIKSLQYNTKEELNVYGMNYVLEKKSKITYQGDLIKQIESTVLSMPTADVMQTFAPELFPLQEVQYFNYNDNHLILNHITEIGGEQIAYSYNYRAESYE